MSAHDSGDGTISLAQFAAEAREVARRSDRLGDGWTLRDVQVSRDADPLCVEWRREDVARLAIGSRVGRCCGCGLSSSVSSRQRHTRRGRSEAAVGLRTGKGISGEEAAGSALRANMRPPDHPRHARLGSSSFAEQVLAALRSLSGRKPFYWY